MELLRCRCTAAQGRCPPHHVSCLYWCVRAKHPAGSTQQRKEVATSGRAFQHAAFVNKSGGKITNKLGGLCDEAEHAWDCRAISKGSVGLEKEAQGGAGQKAARTSPAVVWGGKNALGLNLLGREERLEGGCAQKRWE